MENIKINEDLKNDKVYVRILSKFNDNGQFTFGNTYNTIIYNYEEGDCYDY